MAHLYVDPRRLAGVAAGSEGPACLPLLRDFFAEDDEVTASLLRIVLAQARSGTLDALAHDQVMSMLLQHLLRRHAADRPLAAPAPRVTLTTATLRRLFDHIEQRLPGELRLAELAALARLSEDHFLRAFKAAVGQTPHQYVLARRIVLTQGLLARSALPIGAVARRGRVSRCQPLCRGLSPACGHIAQRLARATPALRSEGAAGLRGTGEALESAIAERE